MLFTVGSIECAQVHEEELPQLQAFLQANPDYYCSVNGAPPGPDEAREQFEFTLPDGWAFGQQWLVAFRDEASIVGMAGLISDLFSPGVWHIGIFIVATSLHGSGVSRELYDGMESWMRGRRARWLRLGVVEGNARAERFWERVGYVDVRRRIGVEMGQRTNNLRVMAKPLAGGALSEYLELVPRDRPDSP